MSQSSNLADQQDAISMRSYSMLSDAEIYNPIEAAMRESVLQMLDNPAQLAALPSEERERIEAMVAVYIDAASSSHVREPRSFVDAASSEAESESEASADDTAEMMTQEANTALTMQMLHDEIGDSIFRDLPKAALFDIIRSVAKVTGRRRAVLDADWATTVKLLDCSAAGNILARLAAWPVCRTRLQDVCTGGAEFERLFAASFSELRTRATQLEGGERTSTEGDYSLGVCDICFSEGDTLLWRKGCCGTSVCVFCLNRWLIDRLTDIQAKLGCPGCSSVFTIPELRHLLSEDSFARREDLLARQRVGNSSNTRDCPRCSCFAQRPRRKLQRRSNRSERLQGGVTVTCSQCNYVWCFECHSPTHVGFTCRQFRSGVHQLEGWAKQMEDSGLRKARRCPKCRAMIEKNDGCNHMTCCNCRHEFCYECGKNWSVRQLRLPYLGWSVFGGHSSRLSVFGCRKRFLPNRTALRRFVRGSLFILRVCGLVLGPAVALGIVLPLVAALVGIAIPLAPVLLIVYIVYLRNKRRGRNAEIPA